MILDVAVAVADEQGRGGPSLHRVAARLGVATSALYRYLRSRSELDVLVSERALGPAPEIPADLPWRERVERWVVALLTRHRQHPWLVDVQGYVPLAPQVLGWLDSLLAALLGANIPLARAVRAATIIDFHVRATALQQREVLRDLTDEERSLWFSPPVATCVANLARTRGLAHVATVLENDVFQESALNSDEPIPGLRLLLDGLANA